MLSAKILVFGVVAVVVSEILAFSAFAIGQAILSAKHAVGTSAAVAQLARQHGVPVPHSIQGMLSTGSASLGSRASSGPWSGAALPGRARAAALGLATIIGIRPGPSRPLSGWSWSCPHRRGVPVSISNAVARYLPANIGLVLFSTHGPPDRVGPAFVRGGFVCSLCTPW